MPYAVLIIAITAIGYFFCTLNQKEKKKLAWHAKNGGLYYRYLVVGFRFTAFGYLLCSWLYWAGEDFNFRSTAFYSFIEPLSKASGSQELADLLIATSLLGLATAGAYTFIENKLIAGNDLKYFYKEIKETGDSFGHVMLVAMENRLNVMVTLDNGKVYIGKVLQFYSPYKDHDWIQVLPLLSGYRKESSKQLEITTDYNSNILQSFSQIVEKYSGNSYPPKVDDFSQLIKRETIISISIINVRDYIDRMIEQRNEKHQVQTTVS